MPGHVRFVQGTLRTDSDNRAERLSSKGSAPAAPERGSAPEVQLQKFSSRSSAPRLQSQRFGFKLNVDPRVQLQEFSSRGLAPEVQPPTQPNPTQQTRPNLPKATTTQRPPPTNPLATQPKPLPGSSCQPGGGRALSQEPNPDVRANPNIGHRKYERILFQTCMSLALLSSHWSTAIVATFNLKLVAFLGNRQRVGKP